MNVTVLASKRIIRVNERQYRVVTVGIPGPPGTSGSGAAYTHTQSSAAVEWIVNHNLGKYPMVSVLSVGLREMDADVQHVSVNQTRIRFATPMSGLAMLQ